VNSSDLLNLARKRLQELKIKQQAMQSLQKQKSEEEKALADIQEQKEATEKARDLTFQYLERGKLRSKTIVEEIGTTALQTIFGEKYMLSIDYSEKRNSSYAELRVTNPIIDDPDETMTFSLNNRGGGVIDVVSMGLSIAMLEMMVPRIEGPLMADESFKHLDVGRHAACAEVMRATLNPDGNGAEGDGRQFIFTTHAKEFINNVDKVFELEIRNDKTIVRDTTFEYINKEME
jgi:DNA repair exonuclease SbcCD ATPase subunit